MEKSDLVKGARRICESQIKPGVLENAKKKSAEFIGKDPMSVVVGLLRGGVKDGSIKTQRIYKQDDFVDVDFQGKENADL